MTKDTAKTFWLDILWISIASVIIYALFLGSYPLLAPDEARYAEIAREMTSSGQYIIPHLNHVIYFEKPIFFYWVTSFFIKIFGLSEWSIRMGPLCFAVLGNVATYIAGNKLFNRKIGIYSAIILSSSLLYFLLAHFISIDMTVSVLLSVSLIAFILGAHEPHKNKRRVYMWTAAFTAALTVLTKGLIGFLFPMMIIGMWVLLLNKWKEIKNWFIPSSFIIFLIVTIPWHVVAQIKQPDFFNFYIIKQQFLRYSTLYAHRYAPDYFFIGIILLGFLPWSVFLCQAIKNAIPKWKNRFVHQKEIFLLLWFALIFIFFSISDSKLIPYILPVFPALSILTAVYLARSKAAIQTAKKVFSGTNIGYYILLLATLALLFVAWKFPIDSTVIDIHAAHNFAKQAAIIAVVIALICNILIWCKCRKNIVFILLFLGATVFNLMTMASIKKTDTRSIKPLGVKIHQLCRPNDLIVSFDHYFQDLPFYARHRVAVVNNIGELEFGMQHLKNPMRWFFDRSALIKKWRGNKRVFIVMHKIDVADFLRQNTTIKFYILGETSNSILISNRGK